MFPSATDGQQANNNMLSPCSRQSISDVLRAKTFCFVGKRVSLLSYIAVTKQLILDK